METVRTAKYWPRKNQSELRDLPKTGFAINYNNIKLSPKGVVNIYPDAKRRGIYPTLFSNSEGDSCFSIYQIKGIKKHFFNFFFWNFPGTTHHFSLSVRKTVNIQGYSMFSIYYCKSSWKIILLYCMNLTALCSLICVVLAEIKQLSSLSRLQSKFPSFPDGKKVLDWWVFVLNHRVFILDYWVFILDHRVLGLWPSFLTHPTIRLPFT